MSPTVHEQLTEQLALVARQIEEHKTAIWLLEQRQLILRTDLAASAARESQTIAGMSP
jgi:hypothetical protein